MSEPVSNVDIEDVLASIRRLVSGGAEQDRTQQGSAREVERLVLAPSQRVDTPGRSEPDETTPESPKAVDETQAEGDPAAPLTAPDTDEMMEAHAPEPEPQPDAAPAEPEPEPESGSVREALKEADAEAEAAAGPAQDDVWLHEMSDGPTGEARAETASETWEPDGDDEDAFAEGAEAPTLEWRDMDEEGDEDSPSVDPDDMDADDAASAAFARDWDDGARAAKEDARATPLDIDEAVLDEEALRDLVAEIVREELMGTLGERITRNVRKLVRREIHRALTCQDFD